MFIFLFLGAGMFVTTVVVGLVAIFHPFTLPHNAFMRDNIYYLGAVFWVFYLLWDNHMDIYVAAIGTNVISSVRFLH